MKNKYILGSGISGLLARDILGDDYTLIPVGKSRFYSFSPALDTNYVVVDKYIEEYMNKYAHIPLFRRFAYSIAGELTFNNKICLNELLSKIYDQHIPDHMYDYMSNRSDVCTIGNCLDIYNELSIKYRDEIMANNSLYGGIKSICDGVIVTDNVSIEYDLIINSLPLPVLFKLVGIDVDPIGCDIHYTHIRTSNLDFEGADEVFVVDDSIDFFKVVKIDKYNYIFMSKSHIEHPGQYFMNFMESFELVAETKVERAICCGNIPDHTSLNDNFNIFSFSRHSVWDDCIDVGSCIKRLLKFREN